MNKQRRGGYYPPAKKIWGLILTMAMLLSFAPCMVTAATSGTCGANVTWTLDDKGTLTISGTGDMQDYRYSNDIPWCSSKESVKNAVINREVTSISNTAFRDCTSLTSVTIPDSVTTIGDYAFWGCESLTSVTIPDSVTTIGDGAFGRCASLASITIPDSVTTIGDGAFEQCASLASITIPDSVTSIGNGAFRNTAYYNNDSNWESGVLYIGNHLIGANYAKINNEYIIKNGTKTIADMAFYGCALTSITIPDSVTTIGDYAFRSCKSLTSINVDGLNQNYCSIDGNLFSKDKKTLIQYAIGKKDTSYTIPDNVTSIGKYVFEYCESLTSITIPDRVTSIGDDAFYACASLTSVTIPDSVTSIGDNAFYGCALTSIIISDSVTSISYAAFMNCKSLTSVTIPDSVTSIGNYAFGWCASLTSVTISDSVTSIRSYAFANCTSLTDVYYSGSEEDWKKISIGSNNERLTSAAIHYNPLMPLPTTTAEITKSETGEAYTFTIVPEKAYANCYVYAAIYDADGALLSVSRVPLNTTGSTSVSAGKSDSDALAKVFIWADSLQPIVEKAQEFPLT